MRLAVIAAVAVAALAAPAASAVPARAVSPGYTVQTGLTFRATGLGPSGSAACDVAYDLYMPDPAPAPHSAPAILFTNGFGGSKSDGAAMARFFAPQGYVVLAYSGLGFGGSGCQIELDSPEWDGRTAAELIDLLGTMPAVRLDGPDDPRVGMFGGSYGGAVQLAAASVSPKLDTIVPQITWNDLAYSLAPNNTSPSFAWDTVPGVAKAEWTAHFFAEGLASPLENLQTRPLVDSTLNGCPGFDPKVCGDAVLTLGTGAPDASTTAFLRHASMVGYGSAVRIPTMLMQGEGDTLFNVDEAVANRAMLMANGAPVKLVLQSWGHSFSGDPTDNTSFSDPARPTYEDSLVQRWFDQYLKGLPVDTGPAVEYFRDWLYDPGAPSDVAAYGAAPSWPIAPMQTVALSAGSRLVPPASVARGSASFASAPGPGSYSETAGLQYRAPFSSIPPLDPPGTYASWTTAPLSADVDVAGVPTLSARITTSVPPVLGLAPTMPVLFGKLYDVAPDGSESLLFPRGVAPIRIADTS
ncbi:MAG TPA: CocE/NonD family hydrolase, partial [Candidatus Dormibacteraeota bacterium]|nr:CocE/NonD family hydrolase [Candidatus Dormibacteraeota bacterium]